MVSDKFRIRHSYLIEQYQYIESHLEGIYATCCRSGFHVGLAEVEKSNIGKIVQAIKHLEIKMGKEILSQELYQKIERVAQERNFWCHNCYFDLAFDKEGSIKSSQNRKRFNDAIKEAEELREDLFDLKMNFLSAV